MSPNTHAQGCAVRRRLCIYAHVYAYMYTMCTYVYIHVHLHAYIYIHSHAYPPTRTHKATRSHTHTHTHTYAGHVHTYQPTPGESSLHPFSLYFFILSFFFVFFLTRIPLSNAPRVCVCIGYAVSRRLVNLPYILWTLAYNCLLLALFLLGELAVHWIEVRKK